MLMDFFLQQDARITVTGAIIASVFLYIKGGATQQLTQGMTKHTADQH